MKSNRYGNVGRWLGADLDETQHWERERIRFNLESDVESAIMEQLTSIPEDVTSLEDFYEEMLATAKGLSQERGERLEAVITERLQAARWAREVLGVSGYHFTVLTAWITGATRGLCVEAKERVAAEFQSHYADAYHDRLGKGLSEQDAHNAAMAGLGKASTARRGLRRTYLTERQAAHLDGLRNGAIGRGPHCRLLLLCMAGIFPILALVLAKRWYLDIFISIGLTGAVYALLFIVSVICRHLLIARWTRTGICLYLLFFICYLYLFFGSAFMVGWSLVMCISYLPILFKVGKTPLGRQ